MIARVAAMGSGVGIALDTSVAERLGLTRGAEVEVIVEDDRIVLIPKASRAARLAAASAEVLAEHDETFRRLAR